MLAVIIKRASDNLAKQEIDVVSLLAHMYQSVKTYENIDISDFTLEDLLSFLRDSTYRPYDQTDETPPRPMTTQNNTDHAEKPSGTKFTITI